jgi:hypothetical protein
VYNATFDNIAKNEGSTCTCSGWINKDIADQGESSSKDGSDVVKLDNIESDGIYQEVALEANRDYTLDLEYWYSAETTTTQYIEVLILKGSTYKSGYTPVYAGPATAAQSGFGYETVASIDDTNNHLARTTIVAPGNTSKNSMSQLTFSTGSETSVAIFVRAVGPYDAGAHGDSTKDKGWMNGDTEIRVDNLVLVNSGATASVDDVFSSKVSVYPNPVKDRLNLSLIGLVEDVPTESSLVISDAMGRSLPWKGVWHENESRLELDFSQMKVGFYVININTLYGVKSIRVVKKSQ